MIVVLVALAILCAVVYLSIEYLKAGKKDKSRFYKRNGDWGEWR